MTSPSPTASDSNLAVAEKLQLDAFIPETLKNIGSFEKGTIESILAYGDKLLLGLSTGALHLYTLKETENEAPVIIKSKVYKVFSTRPIEQLGLLKDAGCLVVLSESIISVFDLETFSLDEKLVKTKGATKFAITSGIRHGDEGAPVLVSRLLVACKSNLVCYEWQDSEFTEYKELNLPDRIKTITFLSPDKAVCGLASDYCVIDVPSSSVSNIVLPGSHDTSFTSLGMSYIGIGGRQSTPHAVTLLDGTALLVKDTTSQFIDPNGQLLDKQSIHWPLAPVTLGFSYPYLLCILPKHIEVRNPETFTILQTINISGVKCFNEGKLAYVASAHKVYRLRCTDFKSHVDTLASNDVQLTEAISLLKLIDPAFIKEKEALLRDLQIRKAILMFKRKHYAKSMALFSDTSATPSMVIELFPAQISGPPEDLIAFADKLKEPSSSDVASESSQPRTLGGDIGPKKSTSDPDSPSQVPPTSDLQPWTDQELSTAIRYLLNYLADTRRKISSLSTPNGPKQSAGIEFTPEMYGDLEEAATLVDTTLFKCYVIRSPALLGPLLRIHNHCDPDTVKTVLSRAEKWRELVDFYFAKQLHKDALELLRKLGANSGEYASSYLDGPETTVRYLQRLDNTNIDLILEYATWPISLKESYGLDLFLEDSKESESLDRVKVLKYLESHFGSLTTKYLEHIVYVKNDTTSLFHTSLVVAYIKALTDSDAKTQQESFEKLILLLKSKPSYYRIEKALSALPKKSKNGLILEVRAILCGQRGQHKEALEIFTYQINDSQKARNYCAELYDSDEEIGRKALHTLLAIYLSPPAGESQKLDLALDLLSSQGSRMSVVEIINDLPNDTSIKDLSVFLMSQIRTFNKAWNTSEMDTSLRKVHLVKTQEVLLTKQQRSVTITNLKTCRVCFKRLGHSVISVFPNGTPIHYGCARVYQQMLDDERGSKKLDPKKQSAEKHKGPKSKSLGES